jgi:hypothetical protein
MDARVYDTSLIVVLFVSVCVQGENDDALNRLTQEDGILHK